MSELNVAISSTGFTSVDKENSIQEPVNNNVVNREEINAKPEENTEKFTKITAREINETVNEMNSFLQNMQRNLSFTVDEQSGQSVILVKDTESDEVIRQIPSEELVVLRKKMDDVVGILFDTKV
jgi:flagellar protein FlaG